VLLLMIKLLLLLLLLTCQLGPIASWAAAGAVQAQRQGHAALAKAFSCLHCNSSIQMRFLSQCKALAAT
jgi:hypothetical protein